MRDTEGCATRGRVSFYWAARVLALASVAAVLLFLVGEGFNPAEVRPREWLLFSFFPIGVVIGLILGWRWEIVGGLVAVLSLGSFYLAHRLLVAEWPRGAAFLVFASPGIVYLLAGSLRRITRR